MGSIESRVAIKFARNVVAGGAMVGMAGCAGNGDFGSNIDEIIEDNINQYPPSFTETRTYTRECLSNGDRAVVVFKGFGENDRTCLDKNTGLRIKMDNDRPADPFIGEEVIDRFVNDCLFRENEKRNVSVTILWNGVDEGGNKQTLSTCDVVGYTMVL